ncbi:MAG TPA: hypothetical protein VIV11_42995 [Kofleriaceae bacterium]
MNRLVVALVALVACGDSNVGGPIPDSGPCVADPVPTGSASCPAICTSCANNVCRIECGAGACNDRTVTCPENYACEVVCTGLDSCDTSTIVCPARYACNVACSAYDSCGDVKLECGSGSCGMTCDGPTESCGGSLIDCGTGGDCKATCNGTSGPTLDCAGACGCSPC